MKTCESCKKEKSIWDFASYPPSEDGLSYRCDGCKEDVERRIPGVRLMGEYRKGENRSLGRFFNSNEFDCKCTREDCKMTYISSVLLRNLDHLRSTAQAAIKITSGFRCKAHNKAVGGVKDSLHTRGMAADVQNKEELIHRLYDIGMWDDEAGRRIPAFKGVGIYPNFLHLDVRRGEEVRWVRT